MLLLYMTVCCVLFGSAARIKVEELCYGSRFSLPLAYTPPTFRGQVYFTPSSGGSRKLMMDKGEAKDPRIKVSYFGSVYFTDLKERDSGIISVSNDEDEQRNIVRLLIKGLMGAVSKQQPFPQIFNGIQIRTHSRQLQSGPMFSSHPLLYCADKIRKNYGAVYHCDVPRQAEFLEFTPIHNVDQPKVLWNRTNPQTSKGGRGWVKRNVWEIIDLTQADDGYYNFRKKDNTLLSRILLTVEENNRYYDPKVNERLFIENPPVSAPWTVTFTPEEEMEPHTLVIAGNLVPEDHFSSRIRVWDDGIEIGPMEIIDSGTFLFRDPQGNLAQHVEVQVHPESVPTFIYALSIVGIIFAVITCCCCVRKCCCKKSSSKRAESAPQTAAAPAVYRYDQNQPARPAYSVAAAPAYSDQPMNSLVSREPATTSLGPSVYSPVNIHVNPSQPEVGPPGGQGAAPAPSIDSDCLSSYPEPRFELKGLTFPSAPPLSSDSTFCDVYTSDKLNFLSGAH